MGTQMLAVTDVIELHYTTITPELLLDRTALNTIDSSSPGQELFNHIIFKKIRLGSWSSCGRFSLPASDKWQVCIKVICSRYAINRSECRIVILWILWTQMTPIQTLTSLGINRFITAIPILTNILDIVSKNTIHRHLLAVRRSL